MTAADRRVRLQIAWRSLRYRLGATLAMLAVAAVGVAAGAFGPIYLHGADESVLQTSLRGSVPANIGLSLNSVSDQVRIGQMEHAAAEVPGTAGGGGRLYGTPIITVDRPITLAAVVPGHQVYGADLIARTGVCGHLVFVEGTCPTAPSSVVVSSRTAKELGLRLGTQVPLDLPHVPQPLKLTISGFYRAPNYNVPYWWGYNYFGFGFGSSSQPEVDDLIVSQQTAVGIDAPDQTPLLAQLPLIASQVTTGNVSQLESELARFERRAPNELGVTASTPLPQLLGAASSDEHTTNTIVEVVLAQLILLALLVLYSVATRTAESRDPDVRLAELRGFGLAGRASVALLEPVAILTVALPLGVLVAWAAGVIAAPSLFSHGGSSSVSLLALGIALLTYAAGIVATVLGARGLVRRPDVGSAAAGRSRQRAIGMAVDTMVVAVAAAAFVEIAISGVSAGRHTDPLAALSPGLLAFGLGVIGARAVPLLARTLVGPTRNSRRVGLSIAVRRLSRLPHLSRHVVVLAISVGLATFAVSGWAVSGHNRTLQSTFEVGAWKVLTVQANPGVNFLDAVERADPNHSAMAAVVEDASDGTTLAVDSSQLADVASWPTGLSTLSASALAHRISRAPGPPVNVSGSAIRITVDLQAPITPAPQLQLTVFDDAYQSESTLNFGSLQSGTHQYTVSTQGACAPTCRLVNLGVTWVPAANSATQSVTVPLTVTALADRSGGGAWRPVDSGLTDPHHWVTTSGGVQLSTNSAGIGVEAQVDEYAGEATFGPNDVPADLPAVVVGSVSGNLGVGLDGATIDLRPVATVDALPGVGSDDTTMVDLALAERLQAGPMTDVTQEVWLAPSAPTDISSRLAAQGVSVVSAQTAAQRDKALSGSGISLAYTFFLLAAVMAALLAIGSTVFVLVAAARRRVGELSALQAVGVGRPVLRRAMLVEQFVVVGTGMVMGVVAGVVAVSVALHSIPEFTSLSAGPPLDYQLPLGPFGIQLVALLVVLVVTVVLTGSLVVGRAPSDTIGGGS
jgi:putative ABC transport system permease protein